MEVGDQCIHAAPAIAGVDEDIGLATVRRQLAIAALAGGFQATHAGGADGDDLVAGGMGAIDLFADRFIDFQPLAVHVMFANVVDAHRLKGAGADMKRDEGRLDTFGAQGFHHRLVEVQPGGGGGHGAFAAGIDGLVALAVRQFVLAGDVWRQRHVAVLLEQGDQWCLAQETQFEQGVSAALDDGMYIALEDQLRAWLGRFARTQMSQPAMGVQRAFQQHLDLAAARLLAEQACWNHAGIIEYHHIAGFEPRQQIGEASMFQRTGFTVDAQQATVGSLFGRVTSDQLVGQIKMKIGALHGVGRVSARIRMVG